MKHRILSALLAAAMAFTVRILLSLIVLWHTGISFP